MFSFQKNVCHNDLLTLGYSKMKTYTKKSLITEIQQIRDKGWVESKRPGNDGAVGNTLEDLLGIEENNLPIPNAAEWELKAQRIGTTSLTTLFHMEPSPTALRFVPQILLPNYGWPHKKAGEKYPQSEMSFRQTIKATTHTDRGFSIVVNKREHKIMISFDHSKISKKHFEWKASVAKRAGLQQLEIQPYWGFDDLFHKVGTKLHNCFFVRAERKKIDGKEYFRYKNILMLQELSQQHFIQAIEDGYVYVDFDARTGHNHGTKFRVRQSIIPDLYKKIKEY